MSLLNFFDLKPLNTSKRPLNVNHTFFKDTLYIYHIDFEYWVDFSFKTEFWNNRNFGLQQELYILEIFLRNEWQMTWVTWPRLTLENDVVSLIDGVRSSDLDILNRRRNYSIFLLLCLFGQFIKNTTIFYRIEAAPFSFKFLPA